MIVRGLMRTAPSRTRWPAATTRPSPGARSAGRRRSRSGGRRGPPSRRRRRCRRRRRSSRCRRSTRRARAPTSTRRRRPSVSTTGIIAAVNGMLSTSPEPTADTHRIPSSSATRSPPVTDGDPVGDLARARRSPRARRPSRTARSGRTASATRSRRSCRAATGAMTSSITAAPASATVAGSRCSGLWTKKTRIVTTRIGTVRRASAGSSIELAASSAITRSRASGAICSRERNDEVEPGDDDRPASRSRSAPGWR